MSLEEPPDNSLSCKECGFNLDWCCCDEPDEDFN